MVNNPRQVQWLIRAKIRSKRRRQKRKKIKTIVLDFKLERTITKDKERDEKDNSQQHFYSDWCAKH